MKRHKKDERVLVDLVVGEGDDYNDECWMWLPSTRQQYQVLRNRVHPHPGVPLAGIMEELECRAEADRLFLKQFPPRAASHPAKGLIDRAEELRSVREAHKIPVISGPECRSCGETVPVPNIGTCVCGCGMTSISVYGQCDK